MASEPRHERLSEKCATLICSLRAACQGVVTTLRTQRNFRIHVAAAAVVLVLAGCVGCPALEWALLVFAIGLVLVAELLNTALEWAVDLATAEWQELAGRAKDAAAAGVLVAALTAAVVGGCVLVPRLLVWGAG